MASPKSPPAPGGASPPHEKSPTPPPAAGDVSPPKSPTPPPAASSAAIEVDDDTASVYAQSAVTDTTSLRSSILQYNWENGRRYHADADASTNYWGPNDERQQVAEDLSHQMHTLIIGGLTDAPISDPKRVLDVGCGTGAWAIDFADENPASEVTGVDISPIQPDFVPPNVRFEVDDINKPWTFPENHFDYVHVRFMLGTVPNWTNFFQSAIRHVKPGGWVEQVELSSILRSDDGTIAPGSVFERWTDIWGKVGDKLGITFRSAEASRPAITAAGFVEVTERILKVPLGVWPKDKKLKAWGEWCRFFCLEGLEGFALRSLTEVLGWSFEEAQLFLVEMRRDLMDPKIHAYTELRIVCGRRPEA